MSSITVGAKVECTDGACGELSALVIHRVQRTITHYVVRTDGGSVERMVPADRVVSSTPSTLRLRCTLPELSAMEPFTRYESLSEQTGDAIYPYYYGYGMGIPDVVPPDPQYIQIPIDLVPAGEVALRQGTDVLALDGRVGSVRSLVVDDSGTITHFAVDQGHRGKRADLTLPLSAIDHVDDVGVHLKIPKAAVHSLPSIPVSRSDHERVQLVAKVFTEPHKAAQALEWLQLAARTSEKPLRIREYAILVRDTDGKPRITQSSQPGIAKGAAVGAAAGALLTLLGPIGLVAGAVVGGGVGAVVGPRVDMGFPDAFLKRLEGHLEPGHSALVVLVEHDQAEDVTEALAESDNVIGGQKLVDTLVQELLLEAAPMTPAEQMSSKH